MKEQLIEAWQTNHRITMMVFDAVDDEGMSCTLSKRGGRDVAAQFAHIHTIRVWHLQERAKDLAEGLVKYTAKDSVPRDELRAALDASAVGIERFLADVLDGVPKRRGFKKGIFTTLSYFVSHEAHHRGSILLTLKQCGRAVDKAVRYNIWDWDRR